MKTHSLKIVVLALVACLAGLAFHVAMAAEAAKEPAATAPAESAPAGMPAALLLANPSGSAIILEGGKVVWEYKIDKYCQDVWPLDNGNILVSGGNKVQEVTRDQKVVWTYQGPAGVKTEIHTCQPLASGNVLIGEGGTGKFLEVERKGGTVVKEVKVDLKGGAHLQMRILRKTPAGHFLLASPGEVAVIEFDEAGKELRRITPETTKGQGVTWKQVHSVELLPNGNLLIGTSYGSNFFEIDKDNKVVWNLTPADVPEIGLSYAPGLFVMADGTYIISAYHSKYPLFAVNKDKKVLWKFASKEIGAPTNVKPIPAGKK